jgi:hypothetical protein
MTATQRTPLNTNFLQPTKFLMSFERLPTVSYQCQSVNLPGVSLGNATYNTPLVDVPLAGNKLAYNELEMVFYIDEELTTWNELYEWMLMIASPEGMSDRRHFFNDANENKPVKSYYSDGSLIVLSGLNNPLVRVVYHRLFPISLSDVQFDTTQSADNILTATATFKYQHFSIEKV